MLNDKRLRALGALGAAIALTGLAACGGGGGKSQAQKAKDYKTQADKVGSSFKTQAQQASQQLQSAPTPAGKVQGLESLKKSVTTAADGFAKLDPPNKSKTTNDALAQNLRTLAGDVNTVEQAVKTKNASAAKTAAAKLQTDQSKINTTLQQLKSQIGG